MSAIDAIFVAIIGLAGIAVGLLEFFHGFKGYGLNGLRVKSPSDHTLGILCILVGIALWVLVIIALVVN